MTTRTDKGHPGLWGPDMENGEVRELCDLMSVVPAERPVPSRRTILERGCRG